MTPIPIAVVDDSAICRQRLREIVEAEGDISVVGELGDGRGILPLLERCKPRVLLTDLVMPRVDGHGVVAEVMRGQPLPILIVSSGGFTQVSAFEALRLGALEVAKKPSHGVASEEKALRAAVRRLASAFVIRHPGHLPAPSQLVSAGGSGLRTPGTAHVRVLGIGASAGGPPAVAAVLGALGRERAPAVVIAQHMPRHHVDDFAGFISRRCQLEVEVCTTSAKLLPGRVLIPGDGMDLVVSDAERVVAQPSESALTPSVDVLFLSMARALGPSAAALVLSGIGNDGAAGLRALQERGALTLAQDEKSCAVYGMPKAAAPFAVQQLTPEQAAACVLSHLPAGLRRVR